MEIKQCDFCRRLHQTLSSKTCRDCLVMLDEDLSKIRKYLYDNEGAGVEEVSEATGVPKKSIMFLLKEERLSVVEGSGDGSRGMLSCESCKKPIMTGRLCVSCKKEVMSAMQNAAPAPAPKKKAEAEEEKNIKGVAKLQV